MPSGRQWVHDSGVGICGARVEGNSPGDHRERSSVGGQLSVRDSPAMDGTEGTADESTPSGTCCVQGLFYPPKTPHIGASTHSPTTTKCVYAPLPMSLMLPQGLCTSELGRISVAMRTGAAVCR